MTQTKPHWFTPTAAAVLIRTDAEQEESIAARAMALRIDRANLHCWREGSVPHALRSEYPRGYGPGQLLRGPERAPWSPHSSTPQQREPGRHHDAAAPEHSSANTAAEAGSCPDPGASVN